MRIFLLSLLSLVFAVSLAPQAAAQIETYHFDKTHTQILFFVNHLGYSNSQGEFLDFDGYFTFDRPQPENSKIDVTINTASIDMDDEKWDDHMKNEDFFNVEHYPEMTFKSTGIEITGDKTANITGDLTLLGITKPVTLAVTHNKSDKHPFGEKYVSGFSATGMIKRSDFGMNYGLPLVSDTVQIRLEVEAIREEQTGEGANNH